MGLEPVALHDQEHTIVIGLVLMMKNNVLKQAVPQIGGPQLRELHVIKSVRVYMRTVRQGRHAEALLPLNLRNIRKNEKMNSNKRPAGLLPGRHLVIGGIQAPKEWGKRIPEAAPGIDPGTP